MPLDMEVFGARRDVLVHHESKSTIVIFKRCTWLKIWAWCPYQGWPLGAVASWLGSGRILFFKITKWDFSLEFRFPNKRIAGYANDVAIPGLGTGSLSVLTGVKLLSVLSAKEQKLSIRNFCSKSCLCSTFVLAGWNVSIG
jgi:hypothetical protein